MVFGRSQEKPKILPPPEILKSSRHIKEIILPKKSLLFYNNLPIGDQFSSALKRAKAQDKFRGHLEKAILGYIQAPVILDDFKDDNPRDELEKTFLMTGNHQVYDFYLSNRLRVSNIRNVLQLVDVAALIDSFWTDKKMLELLKDQSAETWGMVAEANKDNEKKDNFHVYERLNLKDKLAVTEKVARLAREFSIALIESQKR